MHTLHTSGMLKYVIVSFKGILWRLAQSALQSPCCHFRGGGKVPSRSWVVACYTRGRNGVRSQGTHHVFTHRLFNEMSLWQRVHNQGGHAFRMCFNMVRFDHMCFRLMFWLTKVQTVSINGRFVSCDLPPNYGFDVCKTWWRLLAARKQRNYVVSEIHTLRSYFQWTRRDTHNRVVWSKMFDCVSARAIQTWHGSSFQDLEAIRCQGHRRRLRGFSDLGHACRMFSADAIKWCYLFKPSHFPYFPCKYIY